MIIGTTSTMAEDQNDSADKITVYFTVSNKGVIASANDKSIMANREVVVTDENGDGKLTFDDAIVSAHKTFNTEDGYGASNGTGSGRLWGVETQNTLYFINYKGLTGGVNVDKIEDGDYLVASINADESGCYADWYTFFNTDEKEVCVNEEFVLNLKGFYGVAYMPEGLIPAPLGKISIGTWNDGDFSPLTEKTTDENGNVTLSFDEEGTYYVTASGTVRDTVMNWSSFTEVEMDCPIIAPVCKINVVQKDGEAEKPLMSDKEAADIIYAEFSDADKNYSNATKTPLVFPLEYGGETYTNVAQYLKAWAFAETGKEVIVNYTPYIYTTEYNDWSSGELKKIFYDGMDSNTEIHQDYFANNAQKNLNRLDFVSFTVGDVTTDTIDKLCIGVASKIRTPEEIVDYIASQLPFERIINTNSSKDEITDALGEKSGYSVVLPSQSGLYGTALASISWSVQNISGKENAVSINPSTRKMTIIRPNVGEEDAVFDLVATITSKSDESIVKTVDYRITVPSFEGVVVPIEVTEGANLSLTDKYYKTAVDSKYIVKAESVTEGFDLYLCTLHKSALGAEQKFDYEVSKDGYITTTDTFTVKEDNPEKIVISLTPSTEDDSKLASLSLKKPTANSHDVISGFDFDKDVYEYTIKVSGIRTIEFNAEAIAEGASVKITSYYKNSADANNKKLTNGSKAISTKCYLPDIADETSTVIITVTAPQSSMQEIKTRTYTIHIEKVAQSGPLTALTLTPTSSTGGKKDSWAGDDGFSPAEGELSPAFVTGTRTLGKYTVNYWFDKIKIMPTTIAGCSNLVDEENVESGNQSSEIPLVVGENKIPVTITNADGNVTSYTLTVYRKSQLEIVSAEVENGAIDKPFESYGAERSSSGRFSFETEFLRMKFNTNTEGTDIRVKLDGKEYFGKSGEFMEIPVKDKDSAMLFVYLYKTVNEVCECQAYIINMSRMSSAYPNTVASYLPAPGQFVNQSSFSNPETTLAGKQAITLGSFGGSVVYKYDTPIENNPANPYGIDFIIEGNAFTNSDGTSAVSSSEPAAVMVSKDGETWYELAGSEYYDANTIHNFAVTYENPDTSFANSVNIPWKDNLGNSGIISGNGQHSQSYYPNPDIYGAYQKGAGKNESYTNDSVSFSGTKIANSANPTFGYADNHAAGDYSNSPEANPKGNTAANPYIENHYSVYNADGFDIAWAVDSDGNPVELDSISYIKVYNPILYAGGLTGEKSPEILRVLRAEPQSVAVGVTSALTALTINGKRVELIDNKFIYDIDAEESSTFIFSPDHENSNANIYVSNLRVTPGETSKPIVAVNKLRLIVQEDNKEPLIYIFNFTNVNKDQVSPPQSPGDSPYSPDSDLIRVKFSLTGDTVHYDMETGKNTTSHSSPIWIKEQYVSIPKGSTVKYLTEFMLNNANIDYKSDGAYIYKIKGLGAFDNGPKSGWMYRYNGKISDEGAESKKLKDGDVIKWFYSDDYTKENDYEGSFTAGNKGGSDLSDSKTNDDNSADENLDKFFGENTFSDVKADEWYYEAVRYVYENNLMHGSDIGFEPESKMTRAMIVTVLYRLDNSPKADLKHNFTDVADDVWYEDAVSWSYANGLVKGITETEFAPNDHISREQTALIFCRYAKMQGYEVNVNADITGFEDDECVSEWALDAVKWAIKTGLIKGSDKATLSPQGATTRAQFATMLMRFCN